MGSKNLTEEWKDQLKEIDSDYGHHSPYKFLEETKEILKNQYDKEKNYSVKRKFIRNVWYCESIKDYIYFLEKQLHNSIKQLKLAEEGFDNRNKLLDKKIK
jgi:hypothetical protein